MSCNCNATGDEHAFNCPCDSFVHPPAPQIGMGLTEIPRQLAGFPEFRKAMLYAIRPQNINEKSKLALSAWEARQPQDYGVMLLEMWAYVCDTLSFYDKLIAEESYLRTAIQRSSLRRLVALLGYLPRPAVGSVAYLTAKAEGRQKIKLPAGTAFRSNGFDGHPPQVFEMENDAFIHGLTNGWTVIAPPQEVMPLNPDQLMIAPSGEIKLKFPFLLLDLAANKSTQVLKITAAITYTGVNGKLYKNLTPDKPANISAGYPISNLQLLTPKRTAGFWTYTEGAVTQKATSLLMDAYLPAIKTGQYIIVASNTRSEWYQVTAVAHEMHLQTPSQTNTIGGNKITIPGSAARVTRVNLHRTMDDSISALSGIKHDWYGDYTSMTVYYDFEPAGILVQEPKTTLAQNNIIGFKEKVERPVDNFTTTEFILSDRNKTAALIAATLNYRQSSLEMVTGKWNPDMIFPVKAYGNVIQASRGESVLQEIIGSGDASQINQIFKLKNKPLTYFPGATVTSDSALKNTLQVYISGIQWKEVPSFYLRGKEERIYTVRQDDEQESYIMFGDGIHGSRLPSGTDNIIANYRYGAEKPAPPPATITNINKPVTGLSSITNPMAAFGGDDPERASQLRSNAPKSVLTLGRIVSIQDVDAVVRTVAGVKNTQVEWRWQGMRQTPVVHVWYIGESGIGGNVSKKVRAMADPSLPVYIEKATAVTVRLVTDIQIDSDYVEADVLAAVNQLLFNEESGLLLPEQTGIGKPIFRSWLFEMLLSIPGVIAVRNILWNGTTLQRFSVSPGAGKYFQFYNSLIQSSSNMAI